MRVTAAGANVTWIHWSDGSGVPVFQAVVGSPSTAAAAGCAASDDDAVAPVSVSPIDGPGGIVAGAADGAIEAAPSEATAVDAPGSAALAAAEAGDAGVDDDGLPFPPSSTAAPPPWEPAAAHRRGRHPVPSARRRRLGAAGAGVPGAA